MCQISIDFFTFILVMAIIFRNLILKYGSFRKDLFRLLTPTNYLVYLKNWLHLQYASENVA